MNSNTSKDGMKGIRRVNEGGGNDIISEEWGKFNGNCKFAVHEGNKLCNRRGELWENNFIIRVIYI